VRAVRGGNVYLAGIGVANRRLSSVGDET